MSETTQEEYRRRRKLLTDALRSGEYEQGLGQLRIVSEESETHDKFCCLGVACEIFRIQTNTGQWNNSHFVAISNQAWRCCMPDPVRDWYGFSDNNGEFGGCEISALSELNDICGQSFHVIADVIDREPEGLFYS